MNKQLLALSLGMGALILATHQAFSQPANCGARASVLEKLTKKFGEARRGIGLAADNSVIEVFASDATGTWTITLTAPDGTMCLIASGQAYEAGIDDLIPAKGKDT